MIGSVAQPAWPLSLPGGGQPDGNASALPVEFIALLAKLNGVPGTTLSATPAAPDGPVADPAAADPAATAKAPAAGPVMPEQIPAGAAVETARRGGATPRLPAAFIPSPARIDFKAAPALSALPIAPPAMAAEAKPQPDGAPHGVPRPPVASTTRPATQPVPPVLAPESAMSAMPAIMIDTAEIPVEAMTETEEDGARVPDGLEEIADTLASALAAVFAAAGKTVALAFGRPADEAPAPVPAPAQSPLLTVVPPMTIDPEIAGKGARPGMPFVVAEVKPMTKPGAAVPLAAIEPPPADQRQAAADTPELPPLAPLPAPAPATAAALAPAEAPAPAPASASEIVMSHHLDLAKDGEWLDRLARDIARAAGNEAQLRFQLNPEHLGSLRVEIANTADGTAIRLTADTEAARNVLADAQPRLVAEARAQGLRISESHVDMGGHGGQQRGGHESRQPFVRILQPGDEPQAASPRSAAERYA